MVPDIIKSILSNSTIFAMTSCLELLSIQPNSDMKMSDSNTHYTYDIINVSTHYKLHEISNLKIRQFMLEDLWHLVTS